MIRPLAQDYDFGKRLHGIRGIVKLVASEKECVRICKNSEWQ
jgi:hypothetical protein